MNDPRQSTKEAEKPFNIRINEKALATAYAQGAYSDLSKIISDWLIELSKVQFKLINNKSLSLFDFSAEVIGHYLTRPDLNFSQKEFLQLLRLHQPITNLFALSQYKNSDFFLKPTGFESKPSVLQLPLVNARNKTGFSRSLLFSQNALIASEWYGQYLFGVRSFSSELATNNLRDHLNFWDERMILCVSLSNGYMRSTYIDPNIDRHYKHNFNNLVKSKMSSIRVGSNPDKKSIGIVTARWAAVHPTYKNRFQLFKELSKSYDLTLVHIGAERSDLDKSIFKRVIGAKFENGRINAPELFNNQFSMLFYPDIGMNVESRFLSNLRLAPIQVTTNSHPVSTFGSNIDFFLTGSESEEDPASASRHYSERLVLIPGIGTLPGVPTTKTTVGSVVRPLSQDELIVGCPWGSLKINYRLLCLLKRIRGASQKRIKFRFLATLGTDALHHPSTLIDLQDVLGEDVELFADLPYPDYMDKLAEASFALDAFPFGGNTSVVDCLHLNLPIVSRLGWQFYNRAGPVILKRAGLEELVVSNDDDYVDLGCRLINDPSLLESIREKMSAIDLKILLDGLTSTEAFVAACQHLITDRPDASIRSPIVIQ